MVIRKVGKSNMEEHIEKKNENVNIYIPATWAKIVQDIS